MLDFNSGRAVWADVSKSVCIKYRCAKSMSQALDWYRPRPTVFGFLLILSNWDEKLTFCMCGIGIHSVLQMEENIDTS